MQRTVGSGGVGTFDELWEGVAEVSLGFKDVPIVCVNVNGYYDSFQQMLERAFADKLIYRPPNDLLGMESTASVSVCGCILLRCVRMSSLLPLAANPPKHHIMRIVSAALPMSHFKSVTSHFKRV